MNDMSPAGRGSRRRPGGMQEQDRQHRRTPLDDAEGDLRWSTRSRCLAVLRELEGYPIDWDTVQTILEGGAEDVRNAT